jgi:alkylation response protein AidB-like acyl-CoA dehydrogenase
VFDFDPGEELALLAATARDFAAAELLPRLREHEAARAVSEPARAAYAQIGLAALELPEKLGGAGQGALARALVNEELAAADPGAALALDPLGPALYALAECGGEDALRDHALPLLARPGARAVLLCAGDHALRVEGARISGGAPWLPSDRADLVVVLDVGLACAFQAGAELRPLRGAGLRAAGASELVVPGAPLAAAWSDLDGDAEARALARARLYAAALLVGTLRHAAESSRAYAMQRVAFGRPIAHHQALAFLIVDMQMAVDGARLLLHEAAWRADQGLAFEACAAAAFAEAVEASRFVGPAGVQILGGHGFMQDYPLEKAMREARALGLLCGGLDAAREDAGLALCADAGAVALSAGERA